MKRLIVIIVPVMVAAAAALLAILFMLPGATQPAPAGKVMSIESYVSQNISEISPEKEVLGGTFQVTKIDAAHGKGVVSYEDGHNAFTADFTYTMNDRTGIDITKFIIRK